MSHPRYNLWLMFLYLAVVAGVCLLLKEQLLTAFLANWGFNSMILGALAIGILLNVRQVLILIPEIIWIKMYRRGEVGLSLAKPPRLLKALAEHLSRMHRDRFSLTALSLRTVLEGIQGRLDESREISRYMISLLIFLGLLGTFWGLLGTIGAVGQVISGLEVGTQDFALVFQKLKSGLQQPLDGMGTAFSSSLFGLGGSLILGFTDLQAAHAQSRFFNEMEEWLSGATQLLDSKNSEEQGNGTPTELQERQINILIEQVAESNRIVAELLVTRQEKKED